MKIDFSAVITDLDGKPVQDLTLGTMATSALLLPFDDERNLSGDEKMLRFKLAHRIHGGGELELTAEEISLLKKLIAKGYATLVCARAWELLDPASAA